MERVDDLGGGFRLVQDTGLYCFGADSILLSDFARVEKGDMVVDLCAGNGAIAVLLCAKTAAKAVTGVELQEASYRLAVRNISLNGLEGRLAFVHADIADCLSFLRPGSADVVVCNPPYYRPAGSRISPNGAKAAARFEIQTNLDTVLRISAALLRPAGRLYLVHRPERLCDLLCGMRTHRLEPKILQAVHPSCAQPPKLVLIEGIRGGKPGLECRAPIYLTQKEEPQ